MDVSLIEKEWLTWEGVEREDDDIRDGMDKVLEEAEVEDKEEEEEDSDEWVDIFLQALILSQNSNMSLWRYDWLLLE